MDDENVPLTEEEQAHWHALTRRIPATQKANNDWLPILIFKGWAFAFYALSVELAIIREGVGGPEILLIHRKDEWWEGWHTPGGMKRPGVTMAREMVRVFRKEFSDDEPLLSPRFVKSYERTKGSEPTSSERGEETADLYLIRVSADAKPKEGKFFLIDSIPEDTLEHHKYMMPDIQEAVSRR